MIRDLRANRWAALVHWCTGRYVLLVQYKSMSEFTLSHSHLQNVAEVVPMAEQITPVWVKFAKTTASGFLNNYLNLSGFGIFMEFVDSLKKKKKSHVYSLH